MTYRHAPWTRWCFNVAFYLYLPRDYSGSTCSCDHRIEPAFRHSKNVGSYKVPQNGLNWISEIILDRPENFCCWHHSSRTHLPTMVITGLIWLDVVAAVFGIVIVKKLFTKRSSALPPGPSKLPLLENLLDMPTSHEWLTFAEWGKKWGSDLHIVFLSIAQWPMCSTRPYDNSFSIRTANDRRKFGENSNRHDGQKECDILW